MGRRRKSQVSLCSGNDSTSRSVAARVAFHRVTILLQPFDTRNRVLCNCKY